MYSDKAEKNRSWLWYTLAAAVLITLIWLFIRSAGGRENRENAAAAIREELERAEAEGRQPYIHYSDLEASARHPADRPAEEHAETAETAEPASAGGASSPSEPPPAPVEEHAEPAENAEPDSAGGASAPSEPAPAPETTDDLVADPSSESSN